MGTVYLRNTTAPDATYTNAGATLTHAQLDNNMTLFLRNDVDDSMSGTLSTTGLTVTNRINAINGINSNWLKKTSNYTAVAGDFILADTSGGSFTITLPASPSIGNSIRIADCENWFTNNLIIARNGSNIQKLAEDLTMNIKGADVTFVFDGTSWEIFASSVALGGSSGTSTLETVTTSGNTTTKAINITNTTESTSTSTGALIVSGGVGIGGKINIVGNLSANNITASKDSFINGIQIGLGNNNISSNTIIGNSALLNNTTGLDNVAIGYYTLKANIDGSTNTALGSNSLLSNTSGNGNTSIGNLALSGNTIGSANTSMGKVSLYSNISGNYNVAIGNAALQLGTTMSKNTAIGYNSLANSNGDLNIGIGYNAGSAITTGTNNVIVGSYTGNQNDLDIRTSNNYVVLSDGSGNIKALWNNTGIMTSIVNSTGTTGNITIKPGINNGTNNGDLLLYGGDNTSNDYWGGLVEIKGGNSTPIGGNTIPSSGGDVDILGGDGPFPGNIAINTGNSTNSNTGYINIANAASAIVNIGTQMGNNSVLNVFTPTTIYNTTPSTSSTTGALIVSGGAGIGENVNIGGVATATDFNALSDKQYKDNILSITNGINIINTLNPVEFTWISNNKKAYGVIAQEIENILPDIVYTNQSGIKTVSYNQIIPFLISAIQNLQQEINALKESKCQH